MTPCGQNLEDPLATYLPTLTSTKIHQNWDMHARMCG
jgi:hypothetical protein